MSPTRRGPGGSRFAEAEDDEAYQVLSVIPSSIHLTPSHAFRGTEEMESIFPISTPQASARSNVFFGTPDLSRPVTRSATKGNFGSILGDSTQSQAQSRLRLATTRAGGRERTASQLEEARDIDYGLIDGDDRASHEELEVVEVVEVQNSLVEPHNGELGDGHLVVDGSCALRRSDRIRARITREPSPSSGPSAASRKTNRIKKRRKNLAKTTLGPGPLRRSARLAKPLVVFHKYADLPTELQLLIWEAAVQPRLTYICNRSSTLPHANTFGVQNRFPSWFMACHLSVYIAKRCYQKLFGQNGMVMDPVIGIPLHSQDINPFVDIVVFEPCHSGCRGFYCAQQYRREDRAAVQKIAVQIDSPHLPETSEPGWITISRSWPNVETLFMMKPAVKGLDQSDKAMIRIKEGDHEVALRKLFESWKKGAGQHHKLTTLEFVRVVEQEAGAKNIRDRYQSVEDRKTGLAEDIILG
ncbi:hypothetical protein GGS24DRAFT_289238 [Hypoxylon argillaceum]|nr:hypothetical protein GGS24DRAFT_289238 [Hypoxylon argillaceum]